MGNTFNRLIVIECKSCGKLFIPPKYMCPECGSDEFREVALSGEGKVLTYTTIRVPPLGFENQIPYDIAVIQLNEGINMTCRIATQKHRLDIGDTVRFIKKNEGVSWFKVVS